MNIDHPGLRQGKSIAAKVMKEIALRQGCRVLVVGATASHIEKRHKSGPTVITPVKNEER